METDYRALALFDYYEFQEFCHPDVPVTSARVKTVSIPGDEKLQDRDVPWSYRKSGTVEWSHLEGRCYRVLSGSIHTLSPATLKDIPIRRKVKQFAVW